MFSYKKIQLNTTILKSFLFLIGLNTAFLSSAKSDDIIIKKGNTTITEGEIEAAFNDLSPLEAEDMKENTNMLISFIESVFDNKYIANNIKDSLKDDPFFDTNKKLSINTFIYSYYLKNKINKKFETIDFKKLAKSHFNANKSEYSTPDLKDYYHILFLKENNLSDIDAEEFANNLLKDIKSNKITIEKAAKKYQISYAGTNSDGLLLKVNDSSLVGNLKDAVLNMKVGDISPVIETKTGFHIISLKAVHKGEPRKYDDLLEKEIIANLKNKTMRSTVTEEKRRFQEMDSVSFEKEKLDELITKLTGKKPLDEKNIKELIEKKANSSDK